MKIFSLTQLVFIVYIISMHVRRINALQSLRFAFVLFLIPFLPASVRAEEPAAGAGDPELELDLSYAEGLTQLGLPDYAEIVLNRHGAGPKVRVMRLKVFLVKGEFAKVKEIIAKEANQDSEEVWAMKVSLADGYYTWGKYPEARAIYDSFFQKYAKGPPDSLTEFYVGSAYKYAQMLMMLGDEKAALQAFRNTLKAKLERPIERQMKCEMADLLIKMGQRDPAMREAAFTEVDTICKQILWQQDVWFGKAIVMMAHLRMIRGDLDGAMKLVEDYKEQLLQIDEFLKEEGKESGRDMSRLSPMAECRFLVASILQQEAEKKLAAGKPREEIRDLLVGKKDAHGRELPGALQHFVNVFFRYPNTSWGPDAGVHLREVEALLKKAGIEFNYAVAPEQWAKVERAQVQAAKVQFNSHQYADAAEQYCKFLTLFPEGQTAIPAMTDLAVCYMELGDDIFADTVAHHLAERFSRKKSDLRNMAGDAVLLISAAYAERSKSEKAMELEDLFASQFPDHPRTVGFIFRLGEKQFARQDYAAAMGYYTKITTGFTNSPLYFEALSRMAACYKETGKREEEVRMLTQMCAALDARPTPGAQFIAGKYRLAAAYREMGPRFLPSAFNRYAEIIKLLGTDPKRYQPTKAEEDSNAKILEGALFGSAILYTQMTPPEGRPPEEYKLAAIKAFEQLVAKYPKSQWAPSALMQMGAIWTVLDKQEEAQKAFGRLRKEYPESSEAKNVSFMLARTLLALGRREQAIAEFKKMFGDKGGTYAPSQILMAANELQKANENAIALEAYDSVLATAKDRAILEPALAGKGRVLIALTKYSAGVETLEKLLSTYTNTGFTVEACLSLSQGYSELGAKEADENKRLEIFNKAVKAINRAAVFAKTAELQARATLITARVNELKAKAAEQYGPKDRVLAYRGKAVATYMALMNTPLPYDPEARPHIEQAFGECIPLIQSMSRWQEVLDDAARYVKSFPGGKFEPQAHSWMNEAKAKLATQAPAASAPEAGKP